MIVLLYQSSAISLKKSLSQKRKFNNSTCYSSYNKDQIYFNQTYRAPPWSSGSVLDYRSLPPVFKFRGGHIWRLFRLWLRLITFGSRSAHLAYIVHKSGRKTSIIIIIIINQTYSVKKIVHSHFKCSSLVLRTNCK